MFVRLACFRYIPLAQALGRAHEASATPAPPWQRPDVVLCDAAPCAECETILRAVHGAVESSDDEGGEGDRAIGRSLTLLLQCVLARGRKRQRGGGICLMCTYTVSQATARMMFGGFRVCCA